MMLLLLDSLRRGTWFRIIVLDPLTSSGSADALFFNKACVNSWFPKLEVYPLPDNTASVCGPCDHDVPLPPSTD